MRHASALWLLLLYFDLNTPIYQPHASIYFLLWLHKLLHTPLFPSQSYFIPDPLSLACTLSAIETRIPTYPLHTDIQKPTSYPFNTHFRHPAPFPTNSFAHAHPPQQEGSAAASFTVKRAREATVHIKYQSGESAQCGSEGPGQHHAINNHLQSEHLIYKENISP